MQILIYTESDLRIDYSGISKNPHEILYFDIETTGLSTADSDLYLIGCAEYVDGKWQTTLIFNDDGCSEPEMLEYFTTIMDRYSYLVSYNGDTFDIPYIKKKYSQFELPCIIEKLVSVDIYRITRKLKKSLCLTSVKQTDIEELIGFRRSTFISGGDLIDTYKHYLRYTNISYARTASCEAAKKGDADIRQFLSDILTHNHDDIRGLISLTEFVNLKRISDEADITDITVDESYVTYSCTIPKLPCRMSLALQKTTVNMCGTELTVRTPVTTGTLRYYFKDYHNYYYLPVEGTVIHKSVAAYVDSEYKEKATRENAFVCKTSRFVAKPKEFSADSFYTDSCHGTEYMELVPGLLQKGAHSSDYIACILRQALPKL